jgi:predicted Zn finger-like uncharacterized protein
MKVQCGQCPAKYAVSDERIQDKKVRIHCKRCGASIVVDGKVDPPLITSTPARRSVRPASSVPPDPLPSPSPPPEREQESWQSPRPVAHTIMGGLEAPAPERLQRPRSTPPPRPQRSPSGTTPDPPRAGMPGTHRGLTDPPPGADETRWRVALTKQDLRWMTTEEIVSAYQAGAVKLETFVFRTGMPTWVTLLEVPEIADAIAGESEDGSSSLASLMPPPSPSSLPPPRRSLTRDDGLEGEGFEEEDPELNETVPFQLVAERANVSANGREEAAESPAEDSPPEPAEAPVVALASTDHREDSSGRDPGADLPAAVPFAAAQQSSGSSRWIWVVAVVVVLAAAAALLAPRFGVKLL